jgi:hypothetical protein
MERQRSSSRGKLTLVGKISMPVAVREHVNSVGKRCPPREGIPERSIGARRQTRLVWVDKRGCEPAGGVRLKVTENAARAAPTGSREPVAATRDGSDY